MKTTLRVITVYLLEGLEYGIQFSVGEMVERCKAYITAYGEKESGTVNKEHIFCKIYVFM